MVLTLTTDWGDDYYPGAFKGLIYSYEPDCKIIDITHHTPHFDILSAGFSVRNTFRMFPKGSIHVIGVDPCTGEDDRFIAAYAEGHYFLCGDNGLLNHILDEKPEKVVKIEYSDEDPGLSFPTMSILGVAAIRLMRGASMEELGPAIFDNTVSMPLVPTHNEDTITGTIVFVDSFKNAVTNITSEFFYDFCGERRFEIQVKSSRYTIKEISRRYSDVNSGELVALFNISGYLEIAINHGNLCDLLNLKNSDNIIIKFY